VAPRRRTAWAIVIALLAEAIYTIGFGKVTRGGRSVGSIGQPNDLGAYLAIASPFALALMFGVRAWWQRLLLFATSMLGMMALMMAASRAALVAVGVAMFVVVARSSRWALVALVLVMAATPLWLPQNIKDRIITTTVESDDSDDKQLEGGAQERVDTWNTILQVVEDHALDGIGFTGLAYVLPQLGEEMGLNVKDSSHNTYLRMLSETGIAGLALFLAFLWIGWRLGETGMRTARDRFDRQLALGVVAGMIALAISCAFGDRFWEVMIAGNLWVACALTDDLILERRKGAA
jgi:putative inorganic carbon (hco3(-)) transporter